MNPIFKLNEVVVADMNANKGIDLGSKGGIETATVLYIGNETKNYSVGDTILFDKERSKSIEILGEKLLIIHENYVFCQLK